MVYATLAQLREHIDKTTDVDDAILSEILDAATASIDRACNRYLEGETYFAASDAATTRRYKGSGKSYQRIDHCVEIDLVEGRSSPADDWDEWEAADWLAYSGNYSRPKFDTLPYSGIMVAFDGSYSVFYSSNRGPTVRVTARWGGYATPPADIREACIMQAARWYKREQSAMSDTLASGEMGMLLYQKSLDPDIRRILVDGRYVNSVVFGI